MKALALLIAILFFSPFQIILAQGYTIEIINQGSSGNGSPSGGCSSFSIALESAIGVRCGETAALYYPGTGNIVVKKKDNSENALADARAAVDFLLSQPKVGSGVTDALINNVSNAIYWANADQYENLLSETVKLESSDRDTIFNLIKKSQAQPSGTTTGYLQEEYAAKLSAVKNATDGVFDASSRKKEVEVFYNRFKLGSDRFKAALAKAPSQRFQDLNTEVDTLFNEIGSLNSFNPNYDALRAANRWLIDNYTKDGLIVGIGSPLMEISLKTELFSQNSAEKNFAADVRQAINELIVVGKNNPDYLTGVSLLVEADHAYADGGPIEGQRLFDRAMNFRNYQDGIVSNLQLSADARQIFNLSVSSNTFAGNETIQIANYLADIYTNAKGQYGDMAVANAEQSLKIALSTQNTRSIFFHLEAASKLIDQLEGRVPGYFNGSMDIHRGHITANDPEAAAMQLGEVAHSYRAMDMQEQASRMDQMATVLRNFEAGNSLPYQGAKLSDAAKSQYGVVDFKADSFLGYESINLVNTMAATPSLNQNEGLRSAALVIGLSLMSRKNGDLRGGIQDLEQGWSLVDFARGSVRGLYTSAKGTVEGLAQLVFHPVDTAVALGEAIYNYDRTGLAIKKAILQS